VKRISAVENSFLSLENSYFSLFLAEFLSIEFLDFFIFVLSGVTFNVVLPLRLSFIFSSLPSRFGITTPQLINREGKKQQRKFENTVSNNWKDEVSLVSADDEEQMKENITEYDRKERTFFSLIFLTEIALCLHHRPPPHPSLLPLHSPLSLPYPSFPSRPAVQIVD
jgi:hypothetical protein